MQTSNPTVQTPPSVSALLDEIQARADAATPGPWIAVPDAETDRAWVSTPYDADLDDVSVVTDFTSTSDAAFIADARETVPALGAALRAVLDLAAEADLAVADDPDQECGLIHAHHLRDVITTALSGVQRS
jgi:hypothetical protein